MVRKLHGLYICEGSSDEPISYLLEEAFLKKGCDATITVAPTHWFAETKKSVDAKLGEALRRLDGKQLDFVAVHRDVDGGTYEDRKAEILAALEALQVDVCCVPVIPIRMTEAWLLLDEGAIRSVVGRPRGTARLNLPRAGEVERMADPKAALREALVIASETSGRRRDQTRRLFGEHRRTLLESLAIEGPLGFLSGWQKVDTAVADCVSRLSH